MKKLTEVILIIIFLGSFLNMAKVIGLTFWGDFNIYYYSATALIHQQNPYVLKGSFVGGYLYPPISLFIFYPFIIFPITIAGKIWAIVSILSLLLGVWLILRVYNATHNRLLIEIVGILVFNFFPVKFTLGMGQINNVILLLIAVAVYAYEKNRKDASGELLGVSLLLKYFLLLLFPYFLIKRNYRLLITSFVTVLVLTLISFLFIKPEIIFYFFQKTFVVVSTAPGGYYYNQALSGFLIRDFSWLTNSQLTITRYVISAVMLVISFWLIIKNKQNTKKTFKLEMSIIITLSLLLNTFSLQHHFVLLLIPLLITYFILKEHKCKRYYYIILAICYILAAVNIKNPTAYPSIIQSHVFYGAMILWIFDLYLLHKYYQ